MVAPYIKAVDSVSQTQPKWWDGVGLSDATGRRKWGSWGGCTLTHRSRAEKKIDVVYNVSHCLWCILHHQSISIGLHST